MSASNVAPNSGMARVKAFLRLALLGLALQFSISGCATPSRLPAVPAIATPDTLPGADHVRFLVYRGTADFADEAVRALRREQAWLARTGHRGPLPPAYFLAISGGGPSGAFGA